MIREEKSGELIFMRSDVIPFRHAFTTRYGGVSSGHLSSLNLIDHHGDSAENIRENFRRVAEWMGAGVDDCAVTNQVHGNTVRIVGPDDRHVCMSKVPYQADGVVTSVPGLPVFCFTADCVPVLLCDPEAGVIGAIHCGWRSSVSDILGNAVSAMKSLGAESSEIRAAIGPAIGKCCFETDDDVPDAIMSWLGEDTEELFIRNPIGHAPGKTLVDLRGANRRRLLQLGLLSAHIDVSEECTFCCHDRYWSHRYTKGRRGGQGACIVIPLQGARKTETASERSGEFIHA
ncbi:MAG: peptidoglycan editing factor PgeF [Oscillospiraceae bacterium]|nr:peptidoglycan editing factor PgeF [Oscillospiraceae bacterium]